MDQNQNKENTKKFFNKNGYGIIRNVIDKEEVLLLRNRLDNIFGKDKKKRAILADEILNDKHLYLQCFSKKIVKGLSKIIDDINYLPDYNYMRNIAGGWHTDSASEEFNDYLTEDKYCFIKCGLFLQSSKLGWGGSIQIVPKSHIYPLKKYFKSKLIRILIRQTVNKLKKVFLVKTIDINPGDFIFFDSRLLHKSQWPNSKNLKKCSHVKSSNILEGIPKKFTKYALYWNAGNSYSCKKYLNNAQKRIFEENTINDHNNFFISFLSKQYPNDFSSEFIENVKRNDIKICTLKGNRAKLYKFMSRQ